MKLTMIGQIEEKKITWTTIKSFIRKNQNNLWVQIKSSFDSMIDGVRYVDNQPFRKIDPAGIRLDARDQDYVLGNLCDVWVGFARGRYRGSDQYYYYQDQEITGFRVSNCVGCFLLVTDPQGRLRKQEIEYLLKDRQLDAVTRICLETELAILTDNKEGERL